MKSNWIKQSAKTGTIQLVESCDGRELYVTHSKDYDGRSSMWHVWEGEKWLICTPDYHAALHKFDKR